MTYSEREREREFTLAKNEILPSAVAKGVNNACDGNVKGLNWIKVTEKV